MDAPKVRRAGDGTFAGRVKLGMAAAGIRNQAELARKLKIHRQTVHKWLHLPLERIRPEFLFRLADTLRVNPRWLALGGPTSPAPPKALSAEEAEILTIAAALKPKVREAWLTSGRAMMKITADASAGNPFSLRRK